ncbi:hypothetical protein [Brasilonema bromeliae]|uniref:Uncharacterized protein n=1 Tax=Brasilonema bromeliae SPC951 TaxID=385972 RepID=A0ABX1PFX6_9CYAN|nr:hypothetical protein [Brasilonema bromeliae]NMG22853.1 hypothetical protein [Brasilonema bromeliae SPC951]
MHKIIAFGFIALNTLLLLPLPTQAQNTFNLSGEWISAGESVTGNSAGCVKYQGGTYTTNGIQYGATYEAPTRITQSGNQLIFNNDNISNSLGNFTRVTRGTVTGNQVRIESTDSPASFNFVFQGKINENGNVITGLSTCSYRGGSATYTSFVVYYRKTFCSAQPISITELRSLQAQKPSLQQTSRLS